jgi:RimJ/RimL family protein N-acetyltransferase
MLHGKKVTLRAMERDDQAIFWAYDNDLELAILWSDNPTPVSMAATEARFEKAIAETEPSYWFVIEADGKMIGVCDLMDFRSGRPDLHPRDRHRRARLLGWGIRSGCGFHARGLRLPPSEYVSDLVGRSGVERACDPVL